MSGDRDRIDLTVACPTLAREDRSDTEWLSYRQPDRLRSKQTPAPFMRRAAVMRSNFWEASRPRFLSDVELPKVKEGRGGRFSISGTLGEDLRKSKDKKPTVESTESGSASTDNINQSDPVNNGRQVAENGNATSPSAKLEPVRLDLRHSAA